MLQKRKDGKDQETIQSNTTPSKSLGIQDLESKKKTNEKYD